MAGFERGSPGIGNNRAVNCATATVHLLLSWSLLLTEKNMGFEPGDSSLRLTFLIIYSSDCHFSLYCSLVHVFKQFLEFIVYRLPRVM